MFNGRVRAPIFSTALPRPEMFLKLCGNSCGQLKAGRNMLICTSGAARHCLGQVEVGLQGYTVK
jgi:hypothetical protein